jgi:hypothetical protein
MNHMIHYFWSRELRKTIFRILRVFFCFASVPQTRLIAFRLVDEVDAWMYEYIFWRDLSFSPISLKELIIRAVNRYVNSPSQMYVCGGEYAIIL